MGSHRTVHPRGKSFRTRDTRHDQSPVLRNVNALRQTLRDYCDEDGKVDPVIITLPHPTERIAGGIRVRFKA